MKTVPVLFGEWEWGRATQVGGVSSGRVTVACCSFLISYLIQWEDGGQFDLACYLSSIVLFCHWLFIFDQKKTFFLITGKNKLSVISKKKEASHTERRN